MSGLDNNRRDDLVRVSSVALVKTRFVCVFSFSCRNAVRFRSDLTGAAIFNGFCPEHSSSWISSEWHEWGVWNKRSTYDLVAAPLFRRDLCVCVWVFICSCSNAVSFRTHRGYIFFMDYALSIIFGFVRNDGMSECETNGLRTMPYSKKGLAHFSTRFICVCLCVYIFLVGTQYVLQLTIW